MKKALKALTTIGGTALAIIGGVFVYRRFFQKEELEEAFEDEELFEEEEADDIAAFDDEEEIFEDEETTASSADISFEEIKTPEKSDPETMTLEETAPEKTSGTEKDTQNI